MLIIPKLYYFIFFEFKHQNVFTECYNYRQCFELHQKQATTRAAPAKETPVGFNCGDKIDDSGDSQLSKECRQTVF